MPVTTPEVPTEIVLDKLLHTPPGIASVNGMVAPTHTVDGPLIGAGVGFTVIILVAAQPPTVYNIVAVPAPTPVTTPVPEVPVTVATEVAELVHDPPAVASLRVMVEPMQTDDGPEIAAGAALTVIVRVTVHPVPNE